MSLKQDTHNTIVVIIHLETILRSGLVQKLNQPNIFLTFIYAAYNLMQRRFFDWQFAAINELHALFYAIRIRASPYIVMAITSSRLYG